MNRIATAIFAVALLILSARSVLADEPTVVDVWPGKPAGDDASTIGPERWMDPRPGDKWRKWVTNVTKPTLTIYRPPAGKANGASALICPGGGYHALMWDLEGEEVAAWLNSIGVTGIILKYRCPRRPGDPLGVPAPGPLKDAQRAVSLVRSKAVEWGLDPQRIGMIGFSAGGHLVGATATNFNERSYEPIDDVDRVSCRPDFGIMAYPGYFYPLDQRKLSPTVRIIPNTPPLFFVHASDDPVNGSHVQNSIQFYSALRQAGLMSEMHIYDSGGHGFGVRQDGGPTSDWPKACASWLNRLQLLRPLGQSAAPSVRPGPLADALNPDIWRRERRIIDLHQHVDASPDRLKRAAGILDRAGVGVGVILGAGTVTHRDGEASAFQKARELAEARHPGRFLHDMLLDYAGWDRPDWSQQAVRQVEEGHRLGAAGLKEFKRLGLFLKDGQGKLIRIDDPKLDPVWKRCGELGMPISIHVADPAAFWLPFDERNERWSELKDHKDWWFGDPSKYPPRMELLEALNRVIKRHPGTTFVCVHFANNAEDLDWVERSLDSLPNMRADLAARIPEIGRHDPDRVRKLFVTHQDRILFATDFMVYDKLILGSGGDAERPTDEDADEFYRKCWRWLETSDRDWAHMTPIQGNWTISSIGLPPSVSRKVYFDNARKLLARSLPLPVVQARRISRDFVPDGLFDESEWAPAQPARLEYLSRDSAARPDLSTPVRVLWSDKYLYLGYECPFTQLSVFSPPQTKERFGLWENDVVEAFIGSDPQSPKRYTEFEWAPTGESLDLKLNLPEKDFEWTAHAESAVTVDEFVKIWRVEVRIPLTALSDKPPTPGARWRINLYRHDRAHKAGLAFSPTLNGDFHTPERFGWLEFGR